MENGCCAFISSISLWNLFRQVEDGNDLSTQRSDDSDGDGAGLLTAAEEGLPAENVMSILVKNPGLIRVGDPGRDTVLHIAARSGNLETVCKLIAFVDEIKDSELKMVLIDQNIHGDTALHVALKNGHPEIAYYLAKSEKKTASVVNNDGMTPYQLAYEANLHEVLSVMPTPELRISVVPYSLEDLELRTVKINMLWPYRRIAERWYEVYSAINMGEEDIARRLMKDGKKLLRYQDSNGNTLLHAAAIVPGDSALNQLVEFMINNNLSDAAVLQNEDGETALHCAVQEGKLSSALWLIKVAPGSMYLVNHKGFSPLHLAIHQRDRQHWLKQMFREASQSPYPVSSTKPLLSTKNATLAHLAIEANSLDTLKTLMEHLPELINATNIQGWRPLSLAASKGYLDQVTYFLTEFPKSATKNDQDGSPPIHKAVRGGHVSIIQAFLLHCPQSLHHLDTKGRTIIHTALSYNQTEIVAYLVENDKIDDSFLNLKDHEGKICLDYYNAA